MKFAASLRGRSTSKCTSSHMLGSKFQLQHNVMIAVWILCASFRFLRGKLILGCVHWKTKVSRLDTMGVPYAPVSMWSGSGGGKITELFKNYVLCVRGTGVRRFQHKFSCTILTHWSGRGMWVSSVWILAWQDSPCDPSICKNERTTSKRW